MAFHLPRFITGQGSRLGLAGYLQHNIRGWGTATVPSGATSILVANVDIDTNDVVLASVISMGTNTAYVNDVDIVDAVSFTIKVNTDPGVGGAIIGYLILRPTP